MIKDKGVVDNYQQIVESETVMLYSALDEWVNSLQMMGLRPATQRCYADAIRRLKVVLDDMPLSEVTASVFQKALCELAELGYAASTLKHIRVALGKATVKGSR